MNRKIKRLALHVLKTLGVFSISRVLTQDGLRILGYHGISVEDENRFQGMLFMSRETFEQRLEWLVRQRYPILGLEEALEKQQAGSLPPRATALTFDDGWYGTYEWALKLLSERRLPATVYLATYYSDKQTRVFEVAVRYLFWKTRVRRIELEPLEMGLEASVDLNDARQRRAAIETILEHGNLRLDAGGRDALLFRLAALLEVDAADWPETRKFAFMSDAEIRDAAAMGFDIQLHTHRHAISTIDGAVVVREIEENRQALRAFGLDGEQAHFCYPSGHYSPAIWDRIRDAGIRSATTCEAGFNYRTTHPLALHRFLDADYYSPIEFEAEMCGFLELMRTLRRWLKVEEGSLDPMRPARGSRAVGTSAPRF